MYGKIFLFFFPMQNISRDSLTYGTCFVLKSCGGGGKGDIFLAFGHSVIGNFREKTARGERGGEGYSLWVGFVCVIASGRR